MYEQEKRTVRGVLATVIGALCIIAAVAFASQADAAMLKTQFTNEDGDRICVYESHFHEVYVNVGFSGFCSFNVSDDDL